MWPLFKHVFAESRKFTFNTGQFCTRLNSNKLSKSQGPPRNLNTFWATLHVHKLTKCVDVAVFFMKKSNTVVNDAVISAQKTVKCSKLISTVRLCNFK